MRAWARVPVHPPARLRLLTQTCTSSTPPPPPPPGRFLAITPQAGLQHLLRDTQAEAKLGFCLRSAFTAGAQQRLLQGRPCAITPQLARAQKDKVPGLQLLLAEAGGVLVDVAGKGGKGKGSSTGDVIVLGVPGDKRWAVSHLAVGTAVFSREWLQECMVRQRLDMGRALFVA